MLCFYAQVLCGNVSDDIKQDEDQKPLLHHDSLTDHFPVCTAHKPASTLFHPKLSHWVFDHILSSACGFQSALSLPLHSHRFLPKSPFHLEPQPSPPALQGLLPVVFTANPLFIFFSLSPQNNLLCWPLSSAVKLRVIVFLFVPELRKQLLFLLILVCLEQITKTIWRFYWFRNNNI